MVGGLEVQIKRSGLENLQHNKSSHPCVKHAYTAAGKFYLRLPLRKVIIKDCLSRN